MADADTQKMWFQLDNKLVELEGTKEELAQVTASIDMSRVRMLTEEQYRAASAVLQKKHAVKAREGSVDELPKKKKRLVKMKLQRGA